MCHLKKTYFGLEKYLGCIGRPKTDLKRSLKWSPNGSKMVPNDLPPIPMPSVSKRLLPGRKQIKKKKCLMIYYGFMKTKIIDASLKNQQKPYIGRWMEQILVPIPPSPSPASAKVSRQGANTYKTFLVTSMD